MQICDSNACTGCGMCTNICPVSAITMREGKNDFLYPFIDNAKCIECNLCSKKCPANQEVDRKENVRQTYAAWNKSNNVRKRSSSGGVFSLLAESILNQGGIVVGVAMVEMEARHIIIDTISDLPLLNGSKYVQSNTTNIYQSVKQYLEEDKPVMFSGTPCQVHALKLFLRKDYPNLFLVDVICHGVPSKKMLYRHLHEISDGKQAADIKFRYKDPYWDYSYVRIEYENDSQPYQRLTVDDDYYHLFNIGFSLRNSCHHCHYTSTHRQGDITLADYWGYTAHNFEMRKYTNGISLVLVNSQKGQQLLEGVKQNLLIEDADLNHAKKGQKCLSEPFQLPEDKLEAFWSDYNGEMSISELSKKYAPVKFQRPRLLWLRHLKYEYWWLLKR